MNWLKYSFRIKPKAVLIPIICPRSSKVIVPNAEKQHGQTRSDVRPPSPHMTKAPLGTTAKWLETVVSASVLCSNRSFL